MTASDAPPLDGIRVVELGDYLSAGFATSLLGDFGAEVVKVDLPGQVDNNRRIGGTDPADASRSPQFASLCRNKLSVTLDVRRPRGKEALLRLLGESDVLVENFRPGTLERWGMGFDVLAAASPHLIVLRISGFGQTGPWRDRPGVDGIGQAFAGLMSMTGYPDQPPVRAGILVADCGTALLGAFGVVLALQARHRDAATGPTAQVVDAALFEPFMPMLGAHLVAYDRTGVVGERTGNSVPHVTPSGMYRARDGAWVTMSATGDPIFERLTRVIGQESWLDDPSMVDRASRYERREEIEQAVGDWIAGRSAEDAVGELHAAGIPASKVNTVADVLTHPHVEARGTFTRIPDPVYGNVLAHTPVPRLGRTPGSIVRPAPRPGEHNQRILGGLLGFSEAEQAELAEEGRP